MKLSHKLQPRLYEDQGLHTNKIKLPTGYFWHKAKLSFIFKIFLILNMEQNNLIFYYYFVPDWKCIKVVKLMKSNLCILSNLQIQ